MKKITTITTALLIFLITGCNDALKNVLPKKSSTAVSVIGDRTDHVKVAPSEEVLKIYNISDDKIYQGVSIRYKDVEDISLGEVQTFNVPAEYALFSNSNQRVEAMKNFEKQVKQMFDNSQKNYKGTQAHSLVYKSVIGEANLLSKADADQKYLIIYSNMIDNGDINMYDPLVLDLIVKHPDQVMESLDRVMKVESLNGLRVLIVYQPESYSDEKLFLAASHFYDLLLTHAGAEVKIVPSISSI